MQSEGTDPTHPFQWFAVFVAVAAFALLAINVWATRAPTPWERPIIHTILGLPRPGRDLWIAMFEPIPFTLTTFALGFAAAAQGRSRLAVTGVAGCLAAAACCELVLKPLVDRYRTHEVGIHHHLVHLGGPMFPSGHTTAAAAWATFAWLILDRNSRLRPFAVAVPLIVGFCVISKKMHYPADVAGGLLLGPTVVYCTVAATRVADRVLNPTPTNTDEQRDSTDIVSV